MRRREGFPEKAAAGTPQFWQEPLWDTLSDDALNPGSLPSISTLVGTETPVEHQVNSGATLTCSHE